MSAFESPSDGLDGFDFGAFASTDDINTVLINVVNRNNQQALEAGLESFAVKWNIDEYKDPVLTTQSFGNEVVVRLITKDGNNTGTMRIGHFSPILNKIVIYDDLFEDEEDELLAVTEAASIERAETIAKFDQSTNATLPRYDFEHPDVRALHYDHHKTLDEARIVMDALFTLNSNSRNDRSKYTEIDKFSEAAVCLLPKGARFGGQTGPEPNIGIRVVGWFHENNGMKQRQYPKVINLATKDPESDNENDYLPVDDLVEEADLSTLVRLSHDVIVLSHSLGLNDPPLRLDRKEVAVVRNPANPTKQLNP